MAFLPPSSMTLHGGCLCAAIRFTINVPPVSDRPQAPFAAPTPVAGFDGVVRQTTTLLPIIEIDHCRSCNLAAGALVQSWFVSPESWVSWQLLQRVDDIHGAPIHKAQDHEYSNFETAAVIKPSADMCKSTYLSLFVSSENVHRGFCGRCGTSLTYCYTGEKPGWPLPERNFNISLGTLDREFLEFVRPERHGWWTDGIGWVKNMLRNGDQVYGTHLVRHPTGATRTVLEEEIK
jgi:hypothetical protein